MMRTRHIFAGFTFVVGLGTLSAAPALADEVTEFQKRIESVRANYTTTIGLFDQLRLDVEAISVLPDAKAMTGITGQQFESALKSCWEAPLKDVKDAQRQAIDAARAASNFQNRAGMKDLDDTKIELTNALGSVESCGPNAIGAAKVEVDKLNDQAKAALDQKLALVNGVRVLSKKTLPDKSKALGSEAEKLKTDMLASVKKAEGKAAVAAKNPLGGGGKKEQQKVDALKALEADVDGIAALVAKDVPEVGKELGDTGMKVGKNITDVSQLVGEK
jgi:hypothetical protein